VQVLTSTRPAAEDTRARIFAAAREIFALHGPHGTTTREIADRAGVNEATLFRHFGSKSALLDAMKEHFCRQKESLIRDIFAQSTGVLEADLGAIGAAMVTGMTESRDLIRVALLEEAANPQAAVAPWRAPNLARDNLCAFLTPYVRSSELHGDPAVLARVFMGMIFAYVMGRQFWKQAPESSFLDDETRAVETFVRIFLNGARSTT